MSHQLSAQAITAHTAITRISSRRCSILPQQRGSSTVPKCCTRVSMDMARLLAVARAGHHASGPVRGAKSHASPLAAPLGALGGWPSLRTVLAVESIRSVNSAPTKVESEIRYFLSSCPDSPAVLGQAIRSHWAVENALHWVLDVTFREDDSRVRDRTAARNLALLRKIALNIVGRDRRRFPTWWSPYH